jgi:hypothetical protein
MDVTIMKTRPDNLDEIKRQATASTNPPINHNFPAM